MALKVGDIIPNFKAKTQSGEPFELSNYLGKPIVIYFYPKDNTPGCTTQACTFRDQYQDFQDLGAEVIGISGDSEESHDKFAQKYKLPFILLSDSNKKIRMKQLFGGKNEINKFTIIFTLSEHRNKVDICFQYK